MHGPEKAAENSFRRTRFFTGPEALPAAFSHAAARLYVAAGCSMYGKAACLPLSCSMLTVYLIHAVFSPADVVESLTMHVEFKLFLSLPVLFQGIRQGVHSLRHNFLLPFFHAAQAA